MIGVFTINRAGQKMKLTTFPKPTLSDYQDILEEWPILVGIVAVTSAAPFLWELFGL
jgi:hypothetical protein